MVSLVRVSEPNPRRLLLVHAHPDDEVTTTGITMARHAARGDQVTLVTCTLGEEGEIVSDRLKHLHDEGTLAAHRITELQAAMEALGVTDFLRLGGDHRYRDSGMRYGENGEVRPADTLHDDCFWRADLREAADELVPVIRDRRPEVLITYDQYGNYGHPDHIQAHRVAMYAAQLAGIPTYRRDLGEAWVTPRLLWSTISETWFRHGLRVMRDAGHAEEGFGDLDPDGPMPPMVKPDEDIAVIVHDPSLVDRKLAAFRAHESQIASDGWFFRMGDVVGEDAWSREWFVLAGGTPLPPGADDVFAGL
ncbi:N-acetyl-1-D-myo-inositol-2-amino-2-deoxy-alpha-D -glucopyranoside deacetylase [Mariniluteicoccus endophyticus]